MAVPGIVTAGGYAVAAGTGVVALNESYAIGSGTNVLLETAFNGDIHAYETTSMMIDLLGMGLVQSGIDNAALGQSRSNKKGVYVEKKSDDGKYSVEIKGGTYDRLESILEKYDLSEAEYLKLSRTPQHRLSPQNRELVYKIRMELTADVTDASGVVLPGTRVSKSIDKYVFDEHYTQGKDARLGGCVALQRDTDALVDASDIINSTGLKFEGSRFVDEMGNPDVFYIVDGELMEGQPDLVVRVSATTDGLEISDKVAQQFYKKYPDYKYNGYSITDVDSSNDTYLNEIWTRYSHKQVEDLSRLTGISEENIVTEEARWYNKITNPDTGTGITLNQGSSNAMGIPEFYANKGRVNIRNGHIYRVEGKERTLVGTIDKEGTIEIIKK